MNLLFTTTSILALAAFQEKAPDVSTEFKTVAEQSDYRATARHADVVDLADRLSKRHRTLVRSSIGKSGEGRDLVMLIASNPPIHTADEARRSGKPVVLCTGNIHGGEVCGKEALMMLARDWAASNDPLLNRVVVLFVPLLNADGNERVSKENRKHQAGPIEGMGVRTNAEGFDLNRDFVKLETPEIRAVVRCVNEFNPAVIVDTHTTNGSLHRFLMTYDVSRHPAGNQPLIEYSKTGLIGPIDAELETAGFMKLFWYGNFVAGGKRWECAPPSLRYGTQYFALRNKIGVLSEAYVYASFKDRVKATYDFVGSIVRRVDRDRDRIASLINSKSGGPAELGEVICVRAESIAEPGKQTVLGFAGRLEGAPDPKLDPADYEVELWNGVRSKVGVRMPAAYVIPADYKKAVETIKRHGLAVEELREDVTLDVEVYRVDRVERAKVKFQKHEMVDVAVSLRGESKFLPAGSFIVSTRQPLGNLAVQLLEPICDDGLTAWNFFDQDLAPQKDFPVVRVPQPASVLTVESASLPEDEAAPVPLTFDAVLAQNSSGPNLFGLGGPQADWFDGERLLQRKGGKLNVVDAKTGAAVDFLSPAASATAVRIASIKPEDWRGKLDRGDYSTDNSRTTLLFDSGDDLYQVKVDGSNGSRLTEKAGKEELPEFSPDGKSVAFVRDNDLFVVDVATNAEKRITDSGSEAIFNGKADWVYFEEVYNRKWKAFWWSPNSKHLAFLSFDDRGVNKFTVTRPLTPRQELEQTPYPKSGDPNPKATLMLASPDDGKKIAVDLTGVADPEHIILRLCWNKPGDKLMFFVTDRAQTYLDVMTIDAVGGKPPVKLFRETTKAWVDDPGKPLFLSDGSFIFASQRDGWRHLYHYGADGALKKRLTEGKWEVRDIAYFDEPAGRIYFMGTKHCHIAENLYRLNIADGSIDRLSNEMGVHTVEFSPTGKYYRDSWSSRTEPEKTALRNADGRLIRMLDTNPIRNLNRIKRQPIEGLKIETPDGFELEATMVKPPNMEPGKRYPVWLMTYGGPHTPTISDTWRGGGATDQMLANEGIIAFHVDPRSASGKGAESAWTCYRQLGVQELKDLESAADWLAQQPYVDASRIGIEGHSYGGYMTLFALTKSKKFAAGIAGAPVTDWRNYDSIYTERYMNTPQNNPDGYANTSLVSAAKNLSGKLLLLHGFIDDNVHLSNSMQFVNALQQADKSFDLMVYPTARHGIFGKHYQRTKIEFIRRTMLGKSSEAPKEGSPKTAGRPDAE